MAAQPSSTGEVFGITLPELDIRTAHPGGGLARLREHLGRHVDADDGPAVADKAGGNE